MANFLQSELFTLVILPFLLVFTLVFAILQKSKLFGEGKQQIDAIISFVIAAVVISFANAVNIITQLSVFMALALFILFVFMIIYSFAYGDTKGDPLAAQKWLKPAIGIVAIIAVVIAVLIISGYWDDVYNFFTQGELGSNVIFVILIIAAIVAVVKGGGKSEKKE